MNETRSHLWTFQDGKLRKCLRCQTQQHLVNDEWDPVVDDTCSGS